MAFAHVQTKQQSPTAATRATAVTSLSETFASTPSVGNLVVVCLTLFNASGTDTLTTVTDNQSPGNVWTIIPTRPNVLTPGSHVCIVAYSILAVASGTFTVTANYSASSDVDIGISEWSGGPLGVAIGTSSGTGSGTSYAAGSVAPSAVGDLFISVICDNDNAQTYTAPGGWTKRSENADGVNAMVISSASLIAASLAAQAATWTASTSASWAALNVVFQSVSTPTGQRNFAPNAERPNGPGKFRSQQAFLAPDPPPPPGSASFWRLPGPQVGFGRKGGPFTGIVPPRAYVAPTGVGVDLAGSIGGSAALRGDIAIAEALAGAIAGTTTLKADAALAEALAGAIAGTTALAGTASLAEALAGTIAGTTGLSGPLSLAEALRGSVAGTAALSGTLSESIALQGAITGATALPGGLSLAIALAGSIGGAAALKGDLQTQSGAALAGSIGGTSAAVGRLTEAIALAGAIAGSSAFTSEVPASPPAPPSGQRHSGGRPVIRIEERTERVQVLALQVFQKAAREIPTPSSAMAGSTAPAPPAIATLRTASGTASGAGIARAQSGVMVLADHRSSGRGVHNPPDEAPLILGLFYPDLLKARRRTLPEIDRQRHAVLHAEAAIKAHVHSFLHMMAVRLAMLARGRHVHKAAGADDEVKAAAEATDFEQLEQEIAPYLRAVAKDGAREGLRQVDADIEAMLSQANERAVTWANDHAGVLIKGIASTTRERVAELVARSAEEGWAHDRLADEIQGAGVFGDARAETIARTEAAYADISGSLIGWKQSGVVASKEWKASANACDICADMDGEIVALDEQFDFDGEMIDGPPGHPNDRCDVLPVLGDDAE